MGRPSSEGMPQIEDLRRKEMLAPDEVAAMLGIAVYIWLRFEWQFGVGALEPATRFAWCVRPEIGFPEQRNQLRVQADLGLARAEQRAYVAPGAARYMSPRLGYQQIGGASAVHWPSNQYATA